MKVRFEKSEKRRAAIELPNPAVPLLGVLVGGGLVLLTVVVVLWIVLSP